MKIKLISKKRPHINKIINSIQNNITGTDQVAVDFIIEEDVISSLFSNNKKPLTINIYGQDFKQLENIGNDITSLLKKNKKVGNISTGFDKGSPEYKINIDRDKLFSFGINISSLAQTLKTSLTGEVPTKFRLQDEEIDIRVRLDKKYREKVAFSYIQFLTSLPGSP